MDNFFQNIYTTFIYQPFIHLIAFLTTQKSYLIILFALFVGLVTASNKMKNKIWQNVLAILGVTCLCLTIYVGYVDFKPQIDGFFKVDKTTPTPVTPTPVPPATPTTPGTQEVPSQPTAPTDQTTKQMYYSISCYGCWAEGCPNDGYSYSGYDSFSYTYYTALCKACSCNSLNGRSFWK